MTVFQRACFRKLKVQAYFAKNTLPPVSGNVIDRRKTLSDWNRSKKIVTNFLLKYFMRNYYYVGLQLFMN